MAAEDVASPEQTRIAAERPNGWAPAENGFQTDSKRQKPRETAAQTHLTDLENISAGTRASLKQAIAAIEAACIRKPAQSVRAHVETGVAEIDGALGRGLMRGAIHELLPRTAQDMASAAGFAFGLAARAQTPGAHTLYIQHDFTQIETGRPYLPGLKLIGADTAALIYLHVPRAEDVLWAMGEALKCRGFSAVIAEFPPETRVLDLTMTRRLALAAQEGLGFGLILRHSSGIEPNAATTRWLVGSAPSVPDRFGGIGPPNFHLDLVKNRFGPCAQWRVEWQSHDRTFAIPSLSRGLARTFGDRPHRTHAVAKTA
jgi:protein ImuA